MGIDRGERGGIVVNIGSNTSLNPYVSTPIYSATKAAIVSLTRSFGVSYTYFVITYFNLYQISINFSYIVFIEPVSCRFNWC